MGNSNDDRANNAYFALVTYSDAAANDVETTAIDLVTDLFHLAQREGWDMEKIIRMSRMRFEEEA
jgi:hypothetical protein